MKTRLFVVIGLMVAVAALTGCQKEKYGRCPVYGNIYMSPNPAYEGDTVKFMVEVLDNGYHYYKGQYEWKMSGVESLNRDTVIMDPENCKAGQISITMPVKVAGNHKISMYAKFNMSTILSSGQLYGEARAKDLSFTVKVRK
ncbi:MAG: hypothetical protein MJY71_03600 [Bacteroidaceae bacterium]|nr:hypothetical protein [Bacteroidaceae bacterium]